MRSEETHVKTLFHPAVISTLALALTGCPSGKEPPDKTPTIVVQGKTFTLGPGSDTQGWRELYCNKDAPSEIQRCDAGKNLEPKTWISYLTHLPQATAKVDKFEIDQHEVTNAQYKYCEELGECDPPLETDVDGVEYYGVEEYDDHPVVNVTWKQADAYCRFLGKRLPTEAQWEWAARFTKDKELRIYPWEKSKSAPTCAPGQFYTVLSGCVKLPVAIDYSDADKNLIGVRNMASNVAEWTADTWSDYAYCEGGKPYPQSCQLQGENCPQCQADGNLCAKSCDTTSEGLVLCKGGTYWPNLTAGSEKVIRGGDYKHSACFARLYVRRKGGKATNYVGFRCRQ
jgi:formylglycine-generating enzyme required for sulfatase activity